MMRLLILVLVASFAQGEGFRTKRRQSQDDGALRTERIGRHNNTEGMRQLATSVVEKHGALSVRGNKIVDKTGAPVRLRGMSLFWSQWMPQYWNAATVNWLKDDWHMTVIRAAMGIESGGYLENSWAEKGRMEAVVDAAIAAGIYVVIDWHDHHAEQHVEQAKGFFSEMARKYGGYPNVLFELYNEPVHQSWSGTIKPYHEVCPSIPAPNSGSTLTRNTLASSSSAPHGGSN